MKKKNKPVVKILLAPALVLIFSVLMILVFTFILDNKDKVAPMQPTSVEVKVIELHELENNSNSNKSSD